MADIKPCWVRTAHEHHGWTEVSDGLITKVVSLVDASTVLRPPEGSKVSYHHCEGVPDLLEETRHSKYLRQDYRDSVYEVKSAPFGNAEVVTERQVSIDAVYERVIIQEPWREIQRITCFCCSCGDFGSDGYCRNHNASVGMRPCEKHGCMGQEDEDSGIMPDSVQVERKRQGWIGDGDARWRNG